MQCSAHLLITDVSQQSAAKKSEQTVSRQSILIKKKKRKLWSLHVCCSQLGFIVKIGLILRGLILHKAKSLNAIKPRSTLQATICCCEFFLNMRHWMSWIQQGEKRDNNNIVCPVWHLIKKAEQLQWNWTHLILKGASWGDFDILALGLLLEIF